jgi:HRAS-like suppressor 3
VLDSLPLGAHLTTPRRGYVHHGIYAGSGRVIHYAGFSRLFRRGPVEEVSLERFTRGRGFTVKAQAAPKFSGEARVERARSRLGEDTYRFWSNNCEHFVEWCISGASRSHQVETWRMRISNALTILGFQSGAGLPAPQRARF